MTLSRRKLFLSVVALFAFLVTVAYVTAPLPPPKVSLRFRGFTAGRTNTYALIDLKNEGQTMIWPAGRGCLEAEIETKSGWVTNREPRFTFLFFGLPTSSNEVFWVDLPSDVVSWRVTTVYYYYERHNPRIEILERLATSRAVKQLPEFLVEGLGRCLRLLHSPKRLVGEISTPFLTNKPPIGVISGKAQP